MAKLTHDRPHLFYGWVIVAAVFLIGVTEAGVFQSILAIFLKPMSAEFGWSRATIAGAMFFGSILGAIAAPVIGPLVDRHGPRMMAFWGILILSAGLAGLSFLKQVWQLYILFGIGRMITLGMLSLIISVSISNWFIRYRGKAMGIAWLGPRLGGSLLPIFVQFIILYYGWRPAWRALGLLVFCISAIPAVIFLRRRPEDVGLLPDGLPPETQTRGQNTKPDKIDIDLPDKIEEPIWTRNQAIRTPAFWLLTLLNCLLLFPGAGINFNIYPFLTDQGISEPLAIPALSIIYLSGAIGTLLWGFLADRFQTKVIVSIEALMAGLIFLAIFLMVRFGLVWTVGIGIVYVLVAMYGIVVGGLLPLSSILWAEFYGRSSLGSIQGLTGPFKLTANATGPIFGALCFDFFGRYDIPFYIYSACCILSGLLALSIKPPQHRLPVESFAGPTHPNGEI